MSSSKTLAEELEQRLTREILRGERVPGSALPPVRALAEEHRVTVPTIQRVLERLATLGLVTVKRGSGVTVNDPHQSGELSLLPLWFDALSDQPQRVAAILADFLELRRVVAMYLLATKKPQFAAASERLVALALQVTAAKTLEEAMDADLAFSRAVVQEAGQFAVSAVHHTTEQLVRAVPFLADALYGDREFHKRMMSQLATGIASSDPESSIEHTLTQWDHHTVERYRKLLTT